LLYTGLTSTQHNATVSKTLASTLAAAAVFLVTGSQPALALPGQLIGMLFGPTMVRAEVIVQERGVLHDLRLDRGRIAAIGPGTLRLLESDGTVVTLAIAPDAAITLKGRPGRLTDLRRGMNVTTVREGDAAASYVVQPAHAMPAGLSSLLYGPRMVRAEAIVHESGAPRLLRADQGRITAARGGLLRLRERDGTVVTFAVSPTAAITVNGRAARFAELQRGMNAATVREGEGPATIVVAGR
jgi:hypothetical protein